MAKRKGPPGLRGGMDPIWFLLPYLFFFCVFLLYPIGKTIFISLHNWNYLTEPAWVGLKNFLRILSPGRIEFETFWLGVKNTLIFVVMVVPINTFLGLVIAVIVNGLRSAKNLFRFIFYLPVVFSISCVTTTWGFMFDSQIGIVNRILGAFGLESVSWFAVQPYTWIALVVMTIWWSIGRNIIYYLAGLQDISPHLYEAASIDGANAVQAFFHITVPGVTRTMLFVSVLETISQFSMFGQSYILTEGGPSMSTKTAMMMIRQTAFTEFRMGLASSMAVVLGVMVMMLSFAYFKLLRTDS